MQILYLYETTWNWTVGWKQKQERKGMEHISYSVYASDVKNIALAWIECGYICMKKTSTSKFAFFFTCDTSFLHILIHISSNGLFFAPHTNLVWKDDFLGDICFDKGCCKGFIWGCVAGVLCWKWFTSANAGSVFVVGGWVIGLIEVIRRSPTAGAPLPKLGPSIGSPPLPVMKYFTWCFIIQKILVSVTTYFWAIICISWHHCMYLYIIKIYF